MITTQEIENLAQLARIKIGDEEKAKLQHDLVKILDYVSELKSVPKNEVKIDGADGSNNLRADENPLPSLEQGEFVKVKKIL